MHLWSRWHQFLAPRALCCAVLCCAVQGVVEKVVDRFVGEVAMLDSGDVLRVDQAQLETVLPQV
jgi:hypothetical protein